MSKTLPSQIKQRTDVTANWETKNPILALGEVGVEVRVDGTIRQKLGDGTTNWTSLPYSTVLPSDLNNYVPLSGGAMTGPLSVTQVDAVTADNLIPIFSASSKYLMNPERPEETYTLIAELCADTFYLTKKGIRDFNVNGGTITRITDGVIAIEEGVVNSYGGINTSGDWVNLNRRTISVGDQDSRVDIDKSSIYFSNYLDSQYKEVFIEPKFTTSNNNLQITADIISLKKSSATANSSEGVIIEGIEAPFIVRQTNPGTINNLVAFGVYTQIELPSPTTPTVVPLSLEIANAVALTKYGIDNLQSNGGEMLAFNQNRIECQNYVVETDGSIITTGDYFELERDYFIVGVNPTDTTPRTFTAIEDRQIRFYDGTKDLIINSPSSDLITFKSGGVGNDPVRLSGIKDPTEAADAVNKGYVDTNLANYLPLTGGTMSGKVVIEKGYAQASLSPSVLNITSTFTSPDIEDVTINKNGLTMRLGKNQAFYQEDGVLVMGNSANSGVVDSAYLRLDVDTNRNAKLAFSLSGYVDKTFDIIAPKIRIGTSSSGNNPTRTGDIQLDGVASPTLVNQAANKGYVDDGLSKYLPLIGGSISGTLGVDNPIVYTLADRTAGTAAPIALESSTVFEAASGGSNITNKLKFDADGLKVYDSNRASIFSVNMYTGRVVFENADSTESTQFRKDSIYVKQPSGVAATPSQLVKYGGDEVEFRAGPLNSETRVAEIKSTVDGALTVKVADSITFSKTSGSDVTLQGVANPVNATDVANKKYVDDKVAASAGLTQAQADARYLNLAGGTLTGQTNFQKGNYAIIVNDASKSFPSISTMSLDSTQVPLNIIAPSVNLSSPTAGQGVLVKGLADPVEGYDAANKAYVDSVAGSIVAYQSILKFEEVDVKTNPITIIKGLPMESTGCRRIINGNMCFYKIYIYLMDTIDITSGNYLRLGLEGAQPFPSDSTSCTFSINDPVNYPSSCATGVGYITSNNPMYFYLPITSNISVTKVEITAVTNIL